MAKTIPFYQQQVSPGAVGEYQGPTQAQIAATFQPEASPAVAALTGASSAIGELGRIFLQRQQQIQDAYDSAQLAKAKAGYYAAMKKFAEELPYSTTDPIAYQEQLREASEKYFAQAQKLLENTSGGYFLGGPNQKTVRDDFDAWRTEQDAAFTSNVFQSQRARMTDIAVGQIKDDLTHVRNDPEYLEQFVENMKRYMNQNVVSREYGAEIIEAATSIADIATYFNHAKMLGLDQGTLFLADPQNTPRLDEQERNQLQSDFQTYSGQTRAAAERVKAEAVRQSNDKFFKWFFLGENDGAGKLHFLTLNDIYSDHGTMLDSNAPTGSENALTLREQYASMVRARDTGSSTADIKTDPSVYAFLIRAINDPETDIGEAHVLLNNYLVPDANGVFRLDPKDYKVLWSYVEDYKKSTALKNALGAIEQGASMQGLYSMGQAISAQADLSRLYMDRLQAYEVGKGTMMSDDEIAKWVDSFIRTMNLNAAANNLPGKPPKTPVGLADYNESLKVEWFGQAVKRNVKGLKNYEAYIKRAYNGELQAPLAAGDPEHVKARDQSHALSVKWFNEWARDPNGTTAQYRVIDWPNGMTVMTVTRPNPLDKSKNITKCYTIVPDTRDPKNPGIAWAVIDPNIRSDGTYSFSIYPTFVDSWSDMIDERAKLEAARLQQQAAAKREQADAARAAVDELRKKLIEEREKARVESGAVR